MRSNPSAAWDKRPHNIKHSRDMDALRHAPFATKTGKAQAKHDHRSLNKGRAWRMRGTFEVPASRTKLSPITWA